MCDRLATTRDPEAPFRQHSGFSVSGGGRPGTRRFHRRVPSFVSNKETKKQRNRKPRPTGRRRASRTHLPRGRRPRRTHVFGDLHPAGHMLPPGPPRPVSGTPGALVRLTPGRPVSVCPRLVPPWATEVPPRPADLPALRPAGPRCVKSLTADAPRPGGGLLSSEILEDFQVFGRHRGGRVPVAFGVRLEVGGVALAAHLGHDGRLRCGPEQRGTVSTSRPGSSGSTGRV